MTPIMKAPILTDEGERLSSEASVPRRDATVTCHGVSNTTLSCETLASSCQYAQLGGLGFDLPLHHAAGGRCARFHGIQSTPANFFEKTRSSLPSSSWMKTIRAQRVSHTSTLTPWSTGCINGASNSGFQ